MYFSCMQIGFFLASWGMLRGSSFLLNKSVKHYENLIKLISKSSCNPIWNIDVDNYNKDKNLEVLLDYGDRIAKNLSDGDNENVTDTLKTKIILGVFGSVPALDTYNKKALNVHSFSRKNLKKINEFYVKNKDKIDSIKINTIDYYTEKETDRLYSKAKIVDMIGFIAGQKQ